LRGIALYKIILTLTHHSITGKNKHTLDTEAAHHNNDAGLHLAISHSTRILSASDTILCIFTDLVHISTIGLYIVPFTLGHAGKYRRQIKNTENTQINYKVLRKKQTTQNTAKQLYPGLVVSYETWPRGGIGLCSVLRPLQHSIGYMGDGFYRSKDPTNSIKVLKDMLQNTNQTTETT